MGYFCLKGKVGGGREIASVIASKSNKPNFCNKHKISSKGRWSAGHKYWPGSAMVFPVYRRLDPKNVLLATKLGCKLDDLNSEIKS